MNLFVNFHENKKQLTFKIIYNKFKKNSFNKKIDLKLI